MHARSPEWGDWLSRWERMQGYYTPDRDERLALVAEALGAEREPIRTVLELGCGAGSLARRVLARLHGARVIGVDADGALLQLAKRGVPEHADRIRWVHADFVRSDWDAILGAERVEAVVTSMTTHYLPANAIGDLYERVAALLVGGGVFVNSDQARPEAEDESAWRAAEREHRSNCRAAGAETWDEWWTAFSATTSIASGVRPPSANPNDIATTRQHLAALRSAGFRDARILWERPGHFVISAHAANGIP